MKRILILTIKFYRRFISPLKKTFYYIFSIGGLGQNVGCRFHPTCSQYAIEAIDKYGALKGSVMALRRILRCNPFSKGGYDPVK